MQRRRCYGKVRPSSRGSLASRAKEAHEQPGSRCLFEKALGRRLAHQGNTSLRSKRFASINAGIHWVLTARGLGQARKYGRGGGRGGGEVGGEGGMGEGGLPLAIFFFLRSPQFARGQNSKTQRIPAFIDVKRLRRRPGEHRTLWLWTVIPTHLIWGFGRYFLNREIWLWVWNGNEMRWNGH